MRRSVSIALAICVALGLGLGVAGAGRADDTPYTMEPDVRLSGPMRRTLRRIARRYHRRTGERIHVTSGSRSPHEQAEAMYDKLRLGVRLTRLYRDYEAADEIQEAYRAHRRAGRARCVSAMAETIEGQVRRGCFISRHLHDSAVDVRSRTMSHRERRVFRQVVGEVGGVELLEEGRPPHFHLQM